MAHRTILVAVAHPDDVELTCGGSIARWVAEGDRAVLIVATDGGFGGKVVGADAEEIRGVRAAEQERAAAILGFSEVVYLGFPDGSLTDDLVLRGALVEQIRRFKPQVAIVMDPLTVIHRNEYVNHRDHRMLGIAMIDALYPEASNAGYFPEQIERGLEPHKVPELLLVTTDSPNYWVDVSDFIDIRYEALRAHASQIRLWPENGEAVIREQRRLAAELGAAHGYRFAEEFRRVVVNPLS